MELPQLIEALLFASGEPLSLKRIASLLERDYNVVRDVVPEIRASLFDRGVHLLQKGTTLELVSAPEAGRFVEKLRREELEGALSRAALETLAIVLWRGPVARSTIDYLRGVNSSFTLRSLLLRGLIERREDPRDARIALYDPTSALFKYFGLSSQKDLVPHDLQEYRV